MTQRGDAAEPDRARPESPGPESPGATSPGGSFGAVPRETEPMVQLLAPSGERVEHAHFRFDGDDRTIAGLLRDMVLARRIDTEATALQRQGELGLWSPLLGQEAAQVGSGRAFGPNDVAFPTYREHGVAWAMGIDPLTLLGLFRGVSLGGWDPAELRFNLYTVVIGSQTLHATGYAMGIQRDGRVGNDDGTDAATIAYFGDGASSQGDVNEAFVFAASANAPVVFFCQNNQWAISEPTSLQTRVPLYQRAHGFGFPGVRVDGNDVLAVHAVTEWALRRAHAGEGPTLVEAYTYRMGAHTTSDDPSKYREDDELEHWRSRDPIDRVKTYLLGNQTIDQQWLDDLAAESDRLAEHLRRGCRELADPSLADSFTTTYAEEHAPLAAQAAEYAEYVASFGDPDAEVTR
ncbi:pyruvate dehydrogenase (acetyl-transferring) E1 component subunit alpha [Naumannella halotolerans]|uniref:Pyruvate dehydrogenase E1 component alpha subunit n=1 Tax=Naumannella halotolerans TaxID=993414 RepID=A0A4R7J4E5_9ACTN|nr:pyruvate dehydrogenase E1 component alpha subunit [Naumannella halotolerans]